MPSAVGNVHRSSFVSCSWAPLIRQGLLPATFPVGEGDLPVGAWDTGRSGMMRGFFSLIRQGLRPATFPVGEGDLPVGAWDTGRSGMMRGFFSLIRQGLRPATLSVGKGDLRRGRASSGGDEITVRCRRRTGPACRGLRGRRRRARGGR